MKHNKDLTPHGSLPPFMQQAELLTCLHIQVADSISCVTGGILQGSGRQATGAKLNSIAYYVVGLHFGFLFGFYLHLGVTGL
jgi:Na+-driven multidrug efflux pump